MVPSMYVCICRRVSDKQVQKVIAEGAASVEEVGRRCGAGTDCGSCQGEIAEMVHAARRPVVPAWAATRVRLAELSLAAEAV